VINLIEKGYIEAIRPAWAYFVTEEALGDYERLKTAGLVPSVGRPRKPVKERGGETVKCFTLSGNVTYEICPVCQEPDVKVEHGQDTRLTIDEYGTVIEDTKLGPMHHWDCPECGKSTAIVCYDCPLCELPTKEVTTMHDNKSITPHPCPRTTIPDQNTLDMTSARANGHHFLRTMTYKDGGYDAQCLKCPIRVHIHDGQVVDAWR